MCGVNLGFGVGLGGGGIVGFSSGGAHTISLGGFFFRGIRLGLSVWSRCFVGHWGAGAVLLLWGGDIFVAFSFWGGGGFVLVGVLGWVVSCDSMDFGQFPNFIIFFKLFSNSCGNSYIPCFISNNRTLFYLWWNKSLLKH